MPELTSYEVAGQSLLQGACLKSSKQANYRGGVLGTTGRGLFGRQPPPLSIGSNELSILHPQNSDGLSQSATFRVSDQVVVDVAAIDKVIPLPV